MRKGQSPLITGIIICLVGVYLAVYFSLNGMWNAGTVIAMVMIAGLVAFQFVIYFKFFKVDTKKKNNKRRR